GLADELYRALRVDLGARAAAPVLTGDVAASDFPGRAFTVLGVDPFAEAPFRPYLGTADGRSGADGLSARDPLGPVAVLVTRPGAVLVARPTRRARGRWTGSSSPTSPPRRRSSAPRAG